MAALAWLSTQRANQPSQASHVEPEEACSLHQMLPRVLAFLSQDQTGSDAAPSAIDALMESVGLQNNEDALDADWQTLLQDFQKTQGDDLNMSFAEMNAKRKQLTFTSFADPHIPAKVDILDALMSPNISLMERLFSRSKDIGRLHHIPQSDTSTRVELMERQHRGHRIVTLYPQCVS